jgi:predicted nuclease of predicted toxin-antitoxin system
MKILIDMNLSPEWEEALDSAGWSATHWSRVGRPDASDLEILSWAKANNYILFTHDLDFGAILAISRSKSPSVIQIRTQNLTPSHLIPLILRVLNQFQEDLTAGVLISVDESSARARVLPLL